MQPNPPKRNDRVAPDHPSARRPAGVFVGLSTLDVVHRVERAPGVNEKVTARRQDVSAGGPAANAAVVFAALGGHALLITSLGSDPLARLIFGELASRGVHIIDVTPDDPAPPAVSAVAVTEATGERSVVSIDAGTRALPAPEHLDALVSDALGSAALLSDRAESGGVVLIDGHHPALAVAAARDARRRGIPVVVDAGRWKPVMAELLPLADEVICSADFRWPGTTGPDESAGVVRGLASHGSGQARLDGPQTPRLVAVTHGRAPIQWWQGEESGSVPVPAVVVVDTLAAGDAMHGAYAFLRTDPGLSVTERLTGAARVGALRCSVVGPREWLGELDSLTLAGHLIPDPPADRSGPTVSSLPAVDVTLAQLVQRARALAVPGERHILGIVGAPGAGKSTVAAHVAAALGPDVAVLVAMDGFHLANVVLESLGRRDRKGAHDTFDSAGYANLLERLHRSSIAPGRPGATDIVYAPEFRREIEEDIGCAIPVPPGTPLVVTEGNYLLLDGGAWARARACLDEVWFLAPGDDLRQHRLVLRHETFGKSADDARAWALGTDQSNADLIESTAERADLIVRLV